MYRLTATDMYKHSIKEQHSISILGTSVIPAFDEFHKDDLILSTHPAENYKIRHDNNASIWPLRRTQTNQKMTKK